LEAFRERTLGQTIGFDQGGNFGKPPRSVTGRQDGTDRAKVYPGLRIVVTTLVVPSPQGVFPE